MPAEWDPWLTFAVAVAVALVVAVVIAAIVAVPIRLIAKRAGWDPKAVGKIRRPFRVLLAAVGLRASLAFFPEGDDLQTVRDVTAHGLHIAIIGASGWLLAGIVSFLLARTLARYPTDVADNRVARRIHTQVTILRRVLIVVIGIITIGAILLTFDGVEAFGASLLASAGLVSVVAGLAAQSTLSNVFAGLQLAFSDAIRVDDVVIAENEWGRIEEITLTYIVVHIWDDRRLVLPSTYFTTTPFENWTRRGSELLGSIELDVDWAVSPAEMREHLEKVLAKDQLWDGRASVLQITDATGGFVRVRILVTAANAGALWDLRCNVREAMVEWLHDNAPTSLPQTRVRMVEPPKQATRRRTGEDHSGLFSGSAEGEERQQAYTQSVPVQRPAEDQLAAGPVDAPDDRR